MKPIIIEVRDGKICMGISEFRKYIEDAYQHGYSDASLSTSTHNPYWWRDLTCTTGNTTVNALKIDSDENSITGILDANISAL